MFKKYLLLAEAGEGADGTTATPVDRGDNLSADNVVKDKLDDPEQQPAKDKDEEAKADVSVPGNDKTTDLEEGDETPEEKAEREAEEAKAAKKAAIRVPKARLDEVTAKARAREEALQKQIADLKGQLTGTEVKTEVDKVRATIDKMQDDYEDLVQEGKKEEARALRKNIDRMRDELAEFRLATASDRARSAAIDDLKYDAALANVEAKYAALNPDHDDFDEEKSVEVLTLLEAFLAKGFNRTVALQKSVKYVMGPEVAETAKGEDKADTAATLKAKKDAEARRRNAEASSKQPASTKNVGLDSDKAGDKGDGKGIDVLRLSQADFKKLDEKTLAQLRGDEAE